MADCTPKINNRTPHFSSFPLLCYLNCCCMWLAQCAWESVVPSIGRQPGLGTCRAPSVSRPYLVYIWPRLCKNRDQIKCPAIKLWNSNSNLSATRTSYLPRQLVSRRMWRGGTAVLPRRLTILFGTSSLSTIYMQHEPWLDQNCSRLPINDRRSLDVERRASNVDCGLSIADRRTVNSENLSKLSRCESMAFA